MTSVFGLSGNYSNTLTDIDQTVTTRLPSKPIHARVDGTITDPNRFLLPSRKEYNQQYFCVYRARLAAYRSFFQAQIEAIFEQEAKDKDLIQKTPIWANLPDAKPGQPCVIIGTSFKDMDHGVSILHDIGFQQQKPDNSYWSLTLPGDKKSTKMGDGEEESDSGENRELNFFNEKNFCTDNDVLHLEDINGRVPLVFTSNSTQYQYYNSSLLTPNSKNFQNVKPKIVSTHDFTSGILMAIEGELSELTGEFLVTRVFLPLLHSEKIPSPTGSVSIPRDSIMPMIVDDGDDDGDDYNDKTSMNNTENNEIEIGTNPNDTYIAYLSGINFGLLRGPESDLVRNHIINLQLLIEFLIGSLSSNPHEIQQIGYKITDCIIAGDLIGNTPKTAALPPTKRGGTNYTAEKQLTQPASLNQADLFLTKLCSAMNNVYLLPGIHDPTNYSLPQQPLNPCLFPSASTYKSFHGLTNPAQIDIGGISMLGIDGVGPISISKQTHHSLLSSLELTLQSQHLAPTAPDSIGLYPYQDIDPLLFCPINNDDNKLAQFKQPNIFFSGNSPHFQTFRLKCSTNAILTQKQIEPNCSIIDAISIPNFSTTGSFVLMNKRTKQFIPIYLKDELADNAMDGIEDMLKAINLASGKDETHVGIDFEDDDDEGGDMME